MELRVECYAGHKADERPVRFHLGGAAHTVVEILDRWYDPAATFFKLLAGDGNIYILRHHTAEDTWELTSFRRP